MFDPSKPVQTRDGRKARIIATDRIGSSFPIVALVSRGDGEVVHSFTKEGREYDDGSPAHAGDLINIPARREGWINVYRGSGSRPYATGKVVWPTEEAARGVADHRSNRVATVRIEWTE